METMNDNNTFFQIILQAINGNHLSAMEENLLKDALEKRHKSRETERLSRCLAGVIEEEMKKRVEEGDIKKNTKIRYSPILRRCFRETETGNMDASELSKSVIMEFVMEANESFGLNRNDMFLFKSLLQIGLNGLADKGVLGFIPDKKLYGNLIGKETGINFIDNPYMLKEIKSIMNWIEKNSEDARGLAVGLWLTGNISPEEIVGLKREDFYGDKSDKPNRIEIGRNMMKNEEKAWFIKKALELHPGDGKYVFMIRKEGIWRKLNERSLQIKLYYICQSLGIKYKAFHKNEAIDIDR